MKTSHYLPLSLTALLCFIVSCSNHKEATTSHSLTDTSPQSRSVNLTFPTQSRSVTSEIEKIIDEMIQEGIYLPRDRVWVAKEIQRVSELTGLNLDEVIATIKNNASIAEKMGFTPRAGATSATEIVKRIGQSLKSGSLNPEVVYLLGGFSGASQKIIFTMFLMLSDIQKESVLGLALLNSKGELNEDLFQNFVEGKLSLISMIERSSQKLREIRTTLGVTFRARIIIQEIAQRPEAVIVCRRYAESKLKPLGVPITSLHIAGFIMDQYMDQYKVNPYVAQLFAVISNPSMESQESSSR
jgi:hypothetical protein